MAGKVHSYRVAGKTGTAQKSIEDASGYMHAQSIASFIGFLPSDNPQLLCLVVVDSPQTDGRWGNTVGGPVFNAICVEAARYLGIPPTDRIDLTSKKSGRNEFIAPSVKYGNDGAHKEAVSD